MTVVPGPFSLERMVTAAEKVRQRLLRAATALEGAKIPYAVAGGNAVALWLSRVDEAAVRNTQDVDILLRRSHLEGAKRAMEQAGFANQHSAGMEVFLDAPGAKLRDAVRIVFANEKVRPHETTANPDVSDSEAAAQFRVLSLEALVRIKLTAFRDKDKVHIRDLIDVNLVDGTWPARFGPELGSRLQSLLDTPEG
ncbi:MAG TPA: nucleotidyl transferase AbiEii/AbiGii toxin family protein [Tepidisphaeraceae bacterium]